MSEYKPKYEIGSEFYAIETFAEGGLVAIVKKSVDEIRQQAKDTYVYIADGQLFEVSEMYDTTKEVKEQAQKLIQQRFDDNKKAIEEYEG